MPSNKIETVMLKRKKEGRTNYKKRLGMLKSRTPRIVVRRSNKNILAQIITYQPEGDKVEVTVTTKDLEKYGWKGARNNTPSAYLVGLLLSKKAKTKQAVLDIGLHKPTKGGKIFAVLKGCVDGGMEVPFSEDNMPSPERISGKHIENKDVEKQFNETKQKIIKG